MYEFQSETTIGRPLEEVFAFFSDARNLEILTPDFLRFQILTPTPIRLAPGTIIDYRLRIRGIPIRWRSEITVWEPPLRFVDEQRRGPYRTWIHEHRFRPAGEGTLVEDRVRYSHFGGRLVNRLFVAPDIRRIFEFRRRKLIEVFEP